jgi:hypothetical protein
MEDVIKSEVLAQLSLVVSDQTITYLDTHFKTYRP